MGNIGSDSVKTAKQVALKIARQIAREPLEMGKTTRESLTKLEGSQATKTPTSENLPQEKIITPEEKNKMETKKRSMIQALEKELADIRQQKKLKDEEEKQEEIRVKNEEELGKPQETIGVSSKPSRRFGAGIKGHLQRLTKSTETRMPPSG